MIHIELDHILRDDEAVAKIRDIVSEVVATREPYVLTVNGTPSVAIVHVGMLEAATQAASPLVPEPQLPHAPEPALSAATSIDTLGDLAGYAAMNEAARKSMEAASASMTEPFAAPSLPPAPAETPSQAPLETESSPMPVPEARQPLSPHASQPLAASTSPMDDEPSDEELQIGSGSLPPLTGMQALQGSTAQPATASGSLPPLPPAPSSAIAAMTQAQPLPALPDDPENSSPLAG